MASLVRNPNGLTWHLKWYENGRPRIRSLHTSDRAVALVAKLAEERTHTRPPRRGIRWASIGLHEDPRSNTTLTARASRLAEYAAAMLGEEPEKFAWLLNPPRKTTLKELGRIGPSPALKEIASQVCALKLRTVAARTFIVRARGTARGGPSLAVALSRAIGQFAKTYPERFLAENIPAALEGLAGQYRERAAA